MGNQPDDNWESGMTPQERDDWESLVRHVREKTVRGLDRSAIAMMFVDTNEVDVRFAIQLGLCIMMNKPIMLVVSTGVTVPYKMRKVADEIVFADIDTEEGKRKVAAAVARMKKRFNS